MDNTIGIISEVIVLIFNTLIYMQLTVLKKDNLSYRMIMYFGAAVILTMFFICSFLCNT